MFNICTNMPTSEQRIDPYVRAQGLGYSPFNMQFLCHPPIKGDTEIRCNVYIGDVPFI
jgi:hypothetical protein